MHVYNETNLFLSVAGDYRNLTVDGMPDARVPATLRDDLSPNDGITTIWLQGLYPSKASPIPIATWQEAQFIIAEPEPDAVRVRPRPRSAE